MILVNDQLSTATFGRFRAIAELGRGGMARVLLALTQGIAGFNKYVVLKVLREDLHEDPENLQMFLGEARLAARLSHPNIVQTQEVGQDQGRFFICMEYLEGQPLSRVLRATREQHLPLAARLEIICRVLDGLEYAHDFVEVDGSRLGLVHRDISPNNIFVTYDGQVKVLDFGVAKVRGTNVTPSRMFKGKLNYAAPEQLSGMEDARADVFATGVMLWEMLAYRRFAVGNTEVQTLQARMERTEPGIRAVAPATPDALVQICDRALALDVGDRYQSASEFAEDLRAYMKLHSLRFEGAKLAEVMADLFHQERSEARRLIKHRLQEIHEEPPLSRVPPPPSEAPIRSSIPSAAPSDDFAGQAPPATPPAPRSLWAIVAAIASVIAVAAVAVAFLGNPFTAEPVRSTESLAPAPASADLQEVPAATVKLSASPSSARLFWDGRELKSNPYVGEFSMDGSFHRLVVKAEGYWHEERMVLLDADRTVQVSLRSKSKNKK